MTDHNKLRAFAQGLIDEGVAETLKRGIAGAARERARSSAAEEIRDLLDSLPPPTSPDRIPPEIRAALDFYAESGIRTCPCLHAVLEGDLFAAFARADNETMLALPAIVAYIRAQLPPGSYGSPEVVARWIARPRS